jgi:hypothetical protein
LQNRVFLFALILGVIFVLLKQEAGLWFLGLSLISGMYQAITAFGNMLRVGFLFDMFSIVLGFVFLLIAFACALCACWPRWSSLTHQFSNENARTLWLISIGLALAALLLQLYDVPKIVGLVAEKGSEMNLRSRLLYRHGLQPQLYVFALAFPALAMRRTPALWLLIFSLFMLSDDLLKHLSFLMNGSERAAPVMVSIITALVFFSLVLFYLLLYQQGCQSLVFEIWRK